METGLCYNSNIVLEGKCTRCSYRCFGWLLRFPRNQSCPKCGTPLDIYEEGKKIAKGYSPFTAEKYTVDLPTDARPAKEVKKGQEPDQPQRS